MTLELKIPAFADGSEIPKRYTCSGADLSPSLNWVGVSPAARSLALIADDPDAPGRNVDALGDLEHSRPS
jgi:phosphatidylethanolamine-binding protein (PEBP) family uncharacterized protein